jgi:heterodisulfide reductase subunit C
MVNGLDASFQPHKLLHLISRGALDELLHSDAILKCTTCFTCSERCPQGIRVTDILWTLRALATKSGHIPGPVAGQKDALLKTGRLHAANTMDHKKREKAGLPALAEDSPVVSLIFEAAETDE